MRKKMIQFVAYDPHWPVIFDTESDRIAKALGSCWLAVHHVGSTSVPGLCGKPIIDMCVVVRDTVYAGAVLEKIGYQSKGEFNLPFRYFFSKKEPHEINLHLVPENHPEIALNILFRDYLRHHDHSRDLYAALKENLLQDPASFEKADGAMFSGYNLGKDVFIRDILEQAGYAGRRFIRAAHRQEWVDVHRIKKDLFALPGLHLPGSDVSDSEVTGSGESGSESQPGLVYDPRHPSITAEGNHHFILTCGMRTAVVAHVEFLDKKHAALRALAVDGPYCGQGYGVHMMQCLEKWLKNQNFAVVQLHARPEAAAFYRKLGYVDMVFDDLSIEKKPIDLGKIL